MASTSRKTAKKTRRTFRLMPITMTMLTLMLIIKLNDVYINSRQLKELYGVREASAEDKKEAENAAPAAGDAKPETDAKPDAKPEEGGDKPAAGGDKTAAADAGHGEGDAAKEGEKKDAKPEKPEPGVNRTYGTGRTPLSAIEDLKAKEAKPQFTQNEIDLLQNLSKRRDELDQREKDLDVKSKVLDATEKRINDKLSEMKTLQVELNKVVAQYNEKQDTQIKSLVKIYENMKPGDAANIFNEMDMPILLEVIDKMSERKVAPVLAAMDPRKARDVTEELAAMRKSVAKAGGAGN